LDALRPKPASLLPVDEAKALAHHFGIAALEPVIRRVIALEKTVADQVDKIGSLEKRLLEIQSPHSHLRGMEKRNV